MDKAPPPPPAKFPDQPLYVVVQDFLRSKTRKEQIAIAAGAAVVTVGTIYLFVQYRNKRRRERELQQRRSFMARSPRRVSSKSRMGATSRSSQLRARQSTSKSRITPRSSTQGPIKTGESKGATAPRTGTTASKHSTPKTPKKT
ncbi:hypothetical protein Q1695_008739 [Nippostrongylus brasiliensis]|nr:hypothetical protein Q1695_008739 [Nippostrongylus brasiliensis]